MLIGQRNGALPIPRLSISRSFDHEPIERKARSHHRRHQRHWPGDSQAVPGRRRPRRRDGKQPRDPREGAQGAGRGRPRPAIRRQRRRRPEEARRGDRQGLWPARRALRQRGYRRPQAGGPVGRGELRPLDRRQREGPVLPDSSAAADPGQPDVDRAQHVRQRAYRDARLHRVRVEQGGDDLDGKGRCRANSSRAVSASTRSAPGRYRRRSTASWGSRRRI